MATVSHGNGGEMSVFVDKTCISGGTLTMSICFEEWSMSRTALHGAVREMSILLVGASVALGGSLMTLSVGSGSDGTVLILFIVIVLTLTTN